MRHLKRRTRSTTFILVTAAVTIVVGALRCGDADAATQAYWRHEEGPAEDLVPDGPDTVLDSSGNGNHMETFSSGFPPFTAATYVTQVSPLALRSGLENTLALDFGPQPVEGIEDGADPINGNARNDDNFTALDKPIETKLFSAITVELSFNMHDVMGFQVLVGKDGKPLGDAPGEDDAPEQPFAVKVRGDDFPGMIPNQLQVEWIDGDGTLFTDRHFLASGETIVPGQWYHMAFTLSAEGAELWLAKEEGGYLLVDSQMGEDYVGPSGEVIVEDPTPWSIGRGMFGNGVTDWSNAIIDEVRVSDTVLTPEEFLFLPAAVTEDADFNNDGLVDGEDFLIWQRGFGAAGGNAMGDADGDGQVTDADLAVWNGAYGTIPVTAVAAAVPEPAALGLAALALAAAGLRGAARRRQR